MSSSLITYGQIEDRVRTLFEAESSVRWASDKFLDAANDGLDELSEGTGFYERFVSMPMMGGQTYYDLRGFVPDDAFSVNSLFDADAQFWLTPASIQDLRVQKWETVPGSPQKYIMRGLFWVGIYPRPSSDSGTLRVFYSSMAPHFKDDASTLSDLPDDFVPALEDYMMYDLSAKDGETQKALMYWKSYLAREAALRAFVEERIVTARSGRLAQ